MLSPTVSFLRYLHVPDDPDLIVDLQQTAVILLAHIDRLVTPYLPGDSEQKPAAGGEAQQCEVWGRSNDLVGSAFGIGF